MVLTNGNCPMIFRSYPIDFWFAPIIYWYFPIGYQYNWINKFWENRRNAPKKYGNPPKIYGNQPINRGGNPVKGSHASPLEITVLMRVLFYVGYGGLFFLKTNFLYSLGDLIEIRLTCSLAYCFLLLLWHLVEPTLQCGNKCTCCFGCCGKRK